LGDDEQVEERQKMLDEIKKKAAGMPNLGYHLEESDQSDSNKVELSKNKEEADSKK